MTTEIKVKSIEDYTYEELFKILEQGKKKWEEEVKKRQRLSKPISKGGKKLL